MTTSSWQLQIPISAIVFDCDGTLAAIEGIDELARYNGVYVEVATMTKQAMGKTGINPELYKKRLDLVVPRQEQLEYLSQAYFTHCVPDVQAVIHTLKRLNKSIYIVSAGLTPAIARFGDLLQIPRENIFAVDIYFDQQGNYVDFEHRSPLVNNDGKRQVVKQLQSQHQRIIHIGDGLNDYATHDIVTRFIGYGGIYYRENMAALCDYYIRTASLSPLLPLAITPHEMEYLTRDEKSLYSKGLAAIHANQVKYERTNRE